MAEEFCDCGDNPNGPLRRAIDCPRHGKVGKADFKNVPMSLTERAAIRNDDCRMMEPRDLLIRLLRDIDNGVLVPSNLIAIYHVEGDKGTMTGMRRSKVGTILAVGMLEAAKFDLLTSTEIE